MHLKKLSKPNQKCHIEYNSFKNANNICHKNSCNTVPDISKIFLNNYSTKGENHGRGLSIVQNICNNYSNVFFNVKIQDNFFLSELIINTVD